MHSNNQFRPHFPTPFGSVMLGRDFRGEYKKTLPRGLGHTLGLRHIDIVAETAGEVISNFFGGNVNPQFKGSAKNKPKNAMLGKYKSSANQVIPNQINVAVK